MSIAHHPQFQNEPLRSFGNAVEAALHRLHRSGLQVDLDDARQEAWVAVLESSRRYQPGLGRAFSFAHTTAKRAAFNYATRASSPLKLSKHLVESGADVVRERYGHGRAVALDAQKDPDRLRLPVQDPGPEARALDAEARWLRGQLEARGRKTALKRCARGLSASRRRAIRAVLEGSTIAEAAAASRTTTQALSVALRAFVERVRSDVYCAGVAVRLAQLEDR